jgi:hypothetical protein
MEYLKIQNGIVVDAIVASAEFISTLEGTYIESQKGFGISDAYDGTSLTKVNSGPTEEEIAREWRDRELEFTDSIVPLTDHPDHAATLAYRALLRDWPSTSDFPDTKPTI